MEFLMDGTARSVIHRHCPALSNREPPLQRHILARTGTARHAPEATHNLKPDRTAPSRLSALEWRRMMFDPVPTATSCSSLETHTLDTARFCRSFGPIPRGAQ